MVGRRFFSKRLSVCVTLSPVGDVPQQMHRDDGFKQGARRVVEQCRRRYSVARGEWQTSVAVTRLEMQVRCCVTKRCRTVSGCRETGVTGEVLALRKGCCSHNALWSMELIDSQWQAASIRDCLLVMICLRSLLYVMEACLVVRFDRLDAR